MAAEVVRDQTAALTEAKGEKKWDIFKKGD